MTLIIGIKALDSVVLAADSQITYGSTKRTDGSKIENVYFGLTSVLVAQAGSIALGGRFVDIFTESIAGKKLKHPDEVGMAAQKAMIQLRTEIRESKFGCSAEELDEALRREGTEAEIMLGFHFNSVSHLYTVDLRQPVYQKSRSYFEAIGCGASLGQYLLSENTTPAMETKLASIMAIYVVDVVKKYDAFCGGETRIGLIQKEGKQAFYCSYDQDKIRKVSQLLAQADEETKQGRTKTLLEKITDFRPWEVIDFI